MLGDACLSVLKSTLASIARKIIRNHFQKNETLRLHRYHFVRRAIERVSKYWIIALVIVAFTYALVGGVTWFEPLRGPPIPEEVDDYFRDFQAVNAAILGAQASFIGIVFPLVIAFVGLLNQGRASFGTRLTVYFEESAAAFAGSSSIILCFVLVAQMPFSAQVPVSVLAAATTLNILWFATNLAALAFFIFRTIDFIHPAQRLPITKSYVANVAWSRQLLSLVMQNRWANAELYNYLPSGDVLDPFSKQRGVQVSYGPFYDSEPAVIVCRRPPNHELVDIRMGLLKSAVSLWLIRARADEQKPDHSLSLPLYPGLVGGKEIILARSTMPIGWASRFVLRYSIVFRKVRRKPTAIDDCGDILKEMIADLLSLIDQRQAEEFGNQLCPSSGDLRQAGAFGSGGFPAPAG